MDNNFTLDIHKVFMSHALELAKKGRGKVSPNPLVGCVLVKDSEMILELKKRSYYKKKSEEKREKKNMQALRHKYNEEKEKNY